MSTIITLNCCIFSDDPSRIFSINIESNKNIYVLRKAIKDEKKPAFDSITVDSLDLSNVSIEINDLPGKLGERPRENDLCHIV
jgi:Crinkler effector protein N-terminal domain